MQPKDILLLTCDDLPWSVLDRAPGIEAMFDLVFDCCVLSTPVCAVSRSTWYTGLYAWNHGVRGNSPPLGGVKTYQDNGWENQNIAVRLNNLGYRTALAGKYHNGYEGGYVPKGWDAFYGFVGSYASRETVFFEKRVGESRGDRVDHGNALDTNVDAEHAQRVIFDCPAGKPLFLNVNFNAPHSPSPTSDKYRGTRDDVADRDANYGTVDADEDPNWVTREHAGEWTDEEADLADRKFRAQVEAMLPVRDAVADILDALRASGRDAYVFFTSDNGMHVGDHGLRYGKRSYYTEDAVVPLMVTSTGNVDVASGRVGRIVSNVDFAPTFADLVGVGTEKYDGRSLAPFLRGNEPEGWRNALPLRYWFDEKAESPVPTYDGVRTEDEMYARIFNASGEFVEAVYYDLQRDPYQLNNLMGERDAEHLKDLNLRLRGSG